MLTQRDPIQLSTIEKKNFKKVKKNPISRMSVPESQE